MRPIPFAKKKEKEEGALKSDVALDFKKVLLEVVISFTRNLLPQGKESVHGERKELLHTFQMHVIWI